MGSTNIHAFPELRALAEEEARDIWTRHVRLFRERLPDMKVVADPHDASDGFAVTVDAQVERLCDLTRPMSRYAVSVLIGNRIGWDGHSVALSVETGGINIHALFRDCGFKAEPSLNAGADLALIVRHLWPEDSADAR